LDFFNAKATKNVAADAMIFLEFQTAKNVKKSLSDKLENSNRKQKIYFYSKIPLAKKQTFDYLSTSTFIM